MTCGLWFGGFQFLMPTLGFFLGDRFAVVLTNFGPWVAFVLLARTMLTPMMASSTKATQGKLRRRRKAGR